jgi:hypothetical protein
MKRRFAVRRMGLVAGLSLLLAACGGGGDGGGSGTAGGSGTLRLALTDAPACGYDKVNVTIEKVRVHQSASASDSDAGWSEIVLSPAKRVDLLGLTNGVLAELGQTALPAGKYTQLRLVLADNGSAPLANSVVPTGGAEVALTTPSAQQSGLKLSTNIDVASNQLADFVIDFDACKSIVSAGNSGKFLLKPVLAVIPRFISGVSGFVNSSIANGSTTLSLQQAGVTVRSTPPDASGKFLLQPVAPGSYTLVLTAPGRTTLVVTGVTVAADTVSAINLAGATLSPPVSASATVSGTVTMATTPVDASVRALQALSGGPAIEIAARPVDSASGAYSLQLPTAAPLVAIYPTGVATLAFTPDASVAGMYSVQAAAGTSVKTVGPLTLTPGAAGTASFVFP